MKTPARFSATILMAVGIFFAGYLANRQNDPATSSASVEQSNKFLCPMHPQYTSDHSGTCPICGMSLEPASAAGGDEESDPTMVRISAEKKQLVGVKIDTVKVAAATHVMRLPGRITVEDQRLYRIVAATDGWIRKLGQNPAGTFVNKNQILASYYAPNLQTATQTFLSASTFADRLQNSSSQPQMAASFTGTSTYNGVAPPRPPSPLNLQIAVDALRSLGMEDRQIENIQRTRQFESDILIYCPVSGYVVSRSISPGQRFDKGADLYAIADVSRVWVMTDVFEKDREFLSSGAVATVRYRGREFHAQMSNALPQFDPQSRTLKTRFEVENPGSVLLPDMFVDVEIEIKKSEAITVPADAVVDSGLRKTVYVESGAGVFQPRLVKTGWRLGDRVQITEGLTPGERIVVSGNFLIDSESRMRNKDGSGAYSTGSAKVKDLICGMDVDPKSPKAIKAEYKGETYYFCGEGCKRKFEADPEKYTAKDPGNKSEAAKDPVCGMDVDPKAPNAIKAEYKGKTYYFCAEGCKKSFESNPEKYVHKGMAAQDMHEMP